MAWSNNDLISFLELNPELQEILNHKVDTSLYAIDIANLTKRITDNATKIDNHINDNIRHITADERTRWNASKNDAINTSKAYTDGEIAKIDLGYTDGDKLLKDLIDSLNSDLESHISNTGIHVTVADKINWNSSLASAKSYTDSKVSVLTNSINSHIGDSNIHVTSVQKTSWSLSESNANRYTDSEILKLDTKHDKDISDLNSKITKLTTSLNTTNTNLSNAKSALEATDSTLLSKVNEALKERTTTNGGKRLSIQSNAPNAPVVNCELWLNPNDGIIRFYTVSGWKQISAVFV